MDATGQAIASLKPGERLTWAMPPHEYHARPEISSGFVRSMLELGEWTTYHQYVVNKSSKPDSNAMRLGRLFHAAAPDPDGLMRRICVTPTTLRNDAHLAALRKKWLGKTKGSLDVGAEINMHVPAHREYIALHQAEAVERGQEFCTEEERELQLAQAASVQENPETAWLFANDKAKYEQVGFYRDPKTGLVLKGMADVLLDDLVVDFKTTRHHTKREFARAAVGYGGMRVDLQLSHYCRVFDRPRAAVVSVRNFMPTEAMFWELNDYKLKEATSVLEFVLNKIAECKSLGNWHSDGWGQVQALEIEDLP